MNKLIFLDIDGVLNSEEYFLSEAYKKETSAMSDAMIALVEYNTHLDHKAIQLLNNLIDKSGANVVLSSTWRIINTPEQMTKMLQDRGATFKVIDRTPVLYGKVNDRIPRGKEIKAYLKSLKVQPDSFVILDDNNDMLELKNRLVLTRYATGLTIEDVEKALNILNTY